MYKIAIIGQGDVGLPLAVVYRKFLWFDFEKFQKNNIVVFNTKSIIDRKFVDARL